MDPEKLAKMQSQVRIGGKGSVRRKKKVTNRNSHVDDRKVESAVQRLHLNPIPSVDEIAIIKTDGTAIHFNEPRLLGSLISNTFAINGNSQIKKISELHTLETTSHKIPDAKKGVSDLIQEATGLVGGMNQDEQYFCDLLSEYLVGKEDLTDALKNTKYVSRATENINKIPCSLEEQSDDFDALERKGFISGDFKEEKIVQSAVDTMSTSDGTGQRKGELCGAVYDNETEFVEFCKNEDP